MNFATGPTHAADWTVGEPVCGNTTGDWVAVTDPSRPAEVTCPACRTALHLDAPAVTA